MLSSAYVIFFGIVIFHQFLLPFSNAIPSVYDKMFIAFMKGQNKITLSEYSKQKYEAHLGIVYFMRTNWQCDKIGKKFTECERTKCQKYRKYLDILYVYLYREYAGIPSVKPKFAFKDKIEIEGPLIYAVNCLVKISQFYLNSYLSKVCKYKLNKLFSYQSEPKLLNEERLNYLFKFENELQKVTINEMILQLAIDTANNYKTNESLGGIIKQNFDEHFEKIFKNAEERANEKKEDIKVINNDMHFIIVDSKFDDQWKWLYDALFLEFVKGLATNSENFFKMAREYSNYLFRFEETMSSFGLREIEKMKENLTHKYEAYLGVLYLMRKNWQCSKIGKNIKEDAENIEMRKYVHILYEYLFRLYVEAKKPKVSKQLPPLVKPIFMQTLPISLIQAVKLLNKCSKFFWQLDENKLDFVTRTWEMDLVNEDELNYEIKAKKSGEKALIIKETNLAEIRKEFELKMENICRNAIVAKDKLEKAKSETEDDEDKQNLANE